MPSGREISRGKAPRGDVGLLIEQGNRGMKAAVGYRYNPGENEGRGPGYKELITRDIALAISGMPWRYGDMYEKPADR